MSNSPSSDIESSLNAVNAIIIGTVIGFVVMLGAALFWWQRSRRKTARVRRSQSDILDLGDYSMNVIEDASTSIPHIAFKELKVEGQALASGSFKTVYKAFWSKKNRKVALLELRHTANVSRSEIQQESRIFLTLGRHQHLARPRPDRRPRHHPRLRRPRRPLPRYRPRQQPLGSRGRGRFRVITPHLKTTKGRPSQGGPFHWPSGRYWT